MVAGQAGFIDGPRVLANMAIDSWVPHRFAALSDRLTAHYGVLLMAAASLVALVYTHGDVKQLVVMYSINVFLTFSLSMLGMLLLWLRKRGPVALRARRLALFSTGFLLCITILAITVMEKFVEGGWITLVVTGSFVGLCFVIRHHYRTVASQVSRLDEVLLNLPPEPGVRPPGEPDPQQPTAAVLVGSFGGLGVHTILRILQTFPDHYRNLVFVSVGVVDSGELKGEKAIPALLERTQRNLEQYVQFANGLGFPSTSRMALGTEVVEEVEKLARELAMEFPRLTFFAGKLVFRKESWYQRLLHNETAYVIQKRLQWQGRAMVILPVRVQ